MSTTTVTTGRRTADTPDGFGLVSRALHWGMAILFAWQFTSAILHALAKGKSLDSFFWQTHFSVGFTLFVLVLVRGVWGLANLRNRPPHAGGGFERFAANSGQTVLYLLMIVLPAQMIARAVLSGRGLRVYGLQLIQPSDAAVDPGVVATIATVHVYLGWSFLAFIVVHICLALYHGYGRRDATLERMTRGYSRRPLNP